MLWTYLSFCGHLNYAHWSLFPSASHSSSRSTPELNDDPQSGFCTMGHIQTARINQGLFSILSVQHTGRGEGVGVYGKTILYIEQKEALDLAPSPLCFIRCNIPFARKEDWQVNRERFGVVWSKSENKLLSAERKKKKKKTKSWIPVFLIFWVYLSHIGVDFGFLTCTYCFQIVIFTPKRGYPG